MSDGLKNPTIPCHARRHMGAEFHVYDAMMAFAKAGQKEREKKGEPKGPLICSAKLYTIANAINRSTEQVGVGQEKLECNGWIICKQEKKDGKRKRQRRRKGDWSSNEFIVVEHPEWVEQPGRSCPPIRYDPQTGEKLEPGRMAKGLEREWVSQKIGITGSGPFFDFIIACAGDTLRRGRAAKTGNPVLVDALPTTGKPVLDNSATTGKPVTSKTRNPVAPVTGKPVTTTTGNPVTSLKALACGRASHPTQGRLAGWLEQNTATMKGKPRGKIKNALDTLAGERGEEFAISVLEEFINRPETLNGVNQPWALFFAEIDRHISAAIQKMKIEQEQKARAVITEENIAKQKQEDYQRMKTAPAPENGASAEEYFS